MEKLLKRLFLLLVIAFGSVVMTSCGGDDKEDELGTKLNVIGTWVLADDATTSFTFKSDGTGYLTTDEGTNNFNYTLAETSSTGLQLKIWYVGSSKVYTYTVSGQGNSLMLSSGSSVIVLKRKK